LASESRLRKITIFVGAWAIGLALLFLFLTETLNLFEKFARDLCVSGAERPVWLYFCFLFARSLSTLADQIRSKARTLVRETRAALILKQEIRGLNWDLKVVLSVEREEGMQGEIQEALDSDDLSLKREVLRKLRARDSRDLRSSSKPPIPSKGVYRPKVVFIRPEREEQPKPEAETGGNREIVYFTLDRRIQELCSLEGLQKLLSEDVPADIVRAVLFALLKPASGDRTFGERYRKGHSTFQIARHILERMDNQHPSNRDIGKVIRWLVVQGVVRRYKGSSKSTGATYSLENQPGQGSSPEAQELIRHVVRWAREFHQ
jgi:hypothetical protein